MTYRSQRSETGVCSRRWSRRMAAFSWTGSRFRVFLGMGGPPLEVVAYSSRRLVPFQLKQNNAPQRPLLRRCEVALDEEMTMLEQVADLPIEVPSPPDLPFRFRRDGTPAGERRLLRRQALAGLSDGTEDYLVQFREDVEAADLMFGGAEDLGNRPRIESRAVGGDPAQGQPAAGQGRPEAAEESPDIPPSRVA